MNRSELARKAVEIAHRLALRELRSFGDYEDRVTDAGSLAWEFAQTAGPNARPGTIAWYAVKAAASHRTNRARKSLDHPRHGNRRDSEVDVSLMCWIGDDPALIVQAKLDTEAWLATLTAKQRLVAVMYWNGYGTNEIAKVMRWKAGSVSTYRKLLRRKWMEFQEA